MSQTGPHIPGGPPPTDPANSAPSDTSRAVDDPFARDTLANQDQPTGGPQIPGLPEVESVAAISQATDQAFAEEQSLTSFRTPEELANIAANDEHDRDRRFKDAFELIAICSLNLGYLAIATLSLVWALHLVLPKDGRWLSAEDLTHLQTLLTAGVLVGVVGNHFKKRLS